MGSLRPFFDRKPLGHGSSRDNPGGHRWMSKSLVHCHVAWTLLPFVITLAIAAGTSASRAQAGGDLGANAIYGVTSLDVTPAAVSQSIVALKQYRDVAIKQAGNFGVVLLQEADWPNRFVIYESWKDQPAYEANEKSAHAAELRDRIKAISDGPFDRRNYPSSPLRHPASRRNPTRSTCSCISMSFRPDSKKP